MKKTNLTTFDLVKIFLKEGFSKKNNNNKKKKSNAIVIILSIAVLMYLFMFTVNDVTMFSYVLESGGSRFDSLAQVIFIMTMIGFMFAILSGNRLSLTDKDLSILTPLPIPRKRIVSAKLITAFITESAFDIVLGTAAVIAMIIVGGYNYVDFVSMFLALSLSSIFPMTIFSFLMMWLSKLVSKSKFKKPLEMVATTIMIILIMIPSFMVGFMSGGGEITAVFAPKLGKVLSYIPFVFLLKLAIVKSNIIFAILFLVTNIVFFLTFIYLFNKVAYRLMVKEKTFNKVVKVSKIPYKKEKMFKHLFRNEMSKFTAKPLYFTNFVIGPIIFVVLSVIPLFVNVFKEFKSFELEEGVIVNFFPIILSAIVVIVPLFSFLPTVTMSLDKKIMWVYKTYPIRFRDIILSKIAASVLLELAFLMLPIILYTSLGFVSILDALLVLLLAIVTTIVYTSFYVFLSLKHPNNSPDETMVVRQSVSTIIAVFVAMPIVSLSVGAGIIVTLFSGSSLLSLVSITILTAMFGVIWILLLRFKGKKLFVYKYY